MKNSQDLLFIVLKECCRQDTLKPEHSKKKKDLKPGNLVRSTFARLMEEYRDYDKSAFHLPRQYLPQSDGGVCFEEEGG